MSPVVVLRLTPVMSSLGPRPDDKSCSASVRRSSPPVSTTMPSAVRSSATSSLGSNQMKQAKPRTSRTAHSMNSFRPIDLIRRDFTAVLRLGIAERVPRAMSTARIEINYSGKSGGSFNLIDAFQGLVDGSAGGHCRYDGHQHD